MTDEPIAHDIRPLVRELGKPPAEWQREDLLRYCLDRGIRIINFRYHALDGKLKELRLPVNNQSYLERLLTAGERVDGSSLFPGIFRSEESDLYVVPVYRWAFRNPWADDELDIVCRFADSQGDPCALTPDNLLESVAQRLRSRTGADLRALAELEFYLALDRTHDRFGGKSQRNYHQSAPYLHGRAIADEILRVVSGITGCVKYCHSEVGYIDKLESDEPELDGRRVEQYELEFDLIPIEDLGAWLTVARWVTRVIADQHGASATFLPKLDEGMAGSGLHLHLALEREGRSAMHDEDGELSEDALRLIGGLLLHAPGMTAFGNTVAASYLRLVPGQEAPTRVCWGRRNRTSLIRVPLTFMTRRRMDQAMNPDERGAVPPSLVRPTVEYRSPDGSAFTHLLLAALTLCVEDGLFHPAALETARRLEISGARSATPEANRHFEELPPTAVAAAEALRETRSFFEQGGFPERLIDHVLEKLDAEGDEGLSAKLRSLPAVDRLMQSRRLMHKDLHKR
jgi:glutamine synthetase